MKNMWMNNIGFGCASLLGRYGKPESVNVLEHAYERGVRHYDVARSYGYGYAELLLGNVLSCHDDIKISTKFGVLPTRAAKIFSFAKPFVRPFVKKKVPSSLDVNYSNQHIIDEALLAKSIQQSFKALKVNRLHRLFIHEPKGSWAIPNGLSDALYAFQGDRLIDGWGISGYMGAIRQLSNNPLNNTVQRYQSSMNILDCSCLSDIHIESTFSPFHRGYVIDVLSRLSGNVIFQGEFSRIIGCDYSSRSSAFWAVALLSSVTTMRIVFATRKMMLLDENIEAIMFGKNIELSVAQQAILLIKRHSGLSN